MDSIMAFGRTAAHGDLAFGINAHALRALEFPGDGVAQFFRAPGDGVLIDVVGDGFAARLPSLRPTRGNRKSLGHIHGVVLQREPGHLANYGFGKALWSSRKASGAPRLATWPARVVEVSPALIG